MSNVPRGTMSKPIGLEVLLWRRKSEWYELAEYAQDAGERLMVERRARFREAYERDYEFATRRLLEIVPVEGLNVH